MNINILKSFLHISNLRNCLVIVLAIFTLESCTCSGSKNTTDIEWIRDMSQQHSIQAQEGSKDGKILMRQPPIGARAQNRSYYPYVKKPRMASKKLRNPLTSNIETLSQGKAHYENFCIYCHGSLGDSQKGATVAPKMRVKPSNLLTQKVKNYSDGKIYHIIHEGQGFMGAYRIQLTSREQVLMSHKTQNTKYTGSTAIWSVITYIRFLQKSSQANTPRSKSQ